MDLTTIIIVIVFVLFPAAVLLIDAFLEEKGPQDSISWHMWVIGKSVPMAPAMLGLAFGALLAHFYWYNPAFCSK